jgi:hypothetical protein
MVASTLPLIGRWRIGRGPCRCRADLRETRRFPVLVDDAMQAFYTNPVSWKRLAYAGPPMPRAYLDLAHPGT